MRRVFVCVGEQRQARGDVGGRGRHRFGGREYGAFARALDGFGVGRFKAGDRRTRRQCASDQVRGTLVESAALVGPIALARAMHVGPAQHHRDDDDGDAEDQSAEFSQPGPDHRDDDQRHEQRRGDPDRPQRKRERSG